MCRPHGGTCCAGWFPATPLLLCALWHMPFLILEKMCPPYTQKVLDAHLGLATLVVPAVQWTTKDSAHVSYKQLNKMQLVWGGLDSASPVENILLFFLWHRNLTFSIVLWRTPPLRLEILLSVWIGPSSVPLGQRAGQDQLGWLQSTGGVFESEGFFPKLQSAAHRQTVHPNVPLPINTMPFCSGIWDQKGYVSARASLQKQRHVRD